MTPDTIRPFSVYLHRTPDGRVYVGLTKLSPERRWQRGSGYRKNPAFYAAIQKYGWEQIDHKIVASNLSVREACVLESQLIQEYDACNPEKGFNRTDGGGYAFHVNAETAKLIEQIEKCETERAELTKRAAEREAKLIEQIEQLEWLLRERETAYGTELAKQAAKCETERAELTKRAAEREAKLHEQIERLEQSLRAQTKRTDASDRVAQMYFDMYMAANEQMLETSARWLKYHKAVLEFMQHGRWPDWYADFINKELDKTIKMRHNKDKT